MVQCSVHNNRVMLSDALLYCTSALQLGSDADHGWFGRPEHNPTQRPVYLVNAQTGGADFAGSYAAAFAATAVLFKEAGNTTFAATLFKRAEQAFAFATVPAHQKK